MAVIWSTHSCSEIFSLPLLNRSFRLEVAKILEVESLVLAIEFDSALLSALDDGVDVVVDQEPGRE